MDRRDFLRSAGVGLAAASMGVHTNRAAAAPAPSAGRPTRPNILFITADDMGYDSLGCTGCPLPDISPNLDRLAAQGALFDHCYVPTPICGPTRAAWITGTWPQHSGHMGHYNQPPAWFGPSPIQTTLPELLRDHAGYYTGVICKGPDLGGWDCVIDHTDAGLGRDPLKFHDLTAAFIGTAVEQGKPFFLHANSMDPHEYWAGQQYETKAWIDAMMGGEEYETYPNGKPYPDPQLTYAADDIPVPPCWPDNAAMREDLRTYYNSVRRLDETVGEILRALTESARAENTLVVFVSDNGIGRAFAKWSLYPAGVRTPMIVRWPGVTQPGRHDRDSVFSAIDVAPTFLQAAGLEPPEHMDAVSILDLFRGDAPEGERKLTFTCFNYMNNYPEKDAQFPAYTRDMADKHDNYRPMRAIHSKRYTYVWNGWANGTNEIPEEMSSSQTTRRILKETGHEARVQFETFRAREEFYDTVHDPGCLHNRVDDPALQSIVSEFRRELLDVLDRTHDQERDNYRADLLVREAGAK